MCVEISIKIDSKNQVHSKFIIPTGSDNQEHAKFIISKSEVEKLLKWEVVQRTERLPDGSEVYVGECCKNQGNKNSE